MRATLLAVVAAAGLGLAGASGVSAAPINGAAIGHAADATNQIETVQHWRWGSRGFRRCHGRYSSRFWRC